MKRLDGQLVLALSLIALSVFFYLVDYAIFQDARLILVNLVDNIAFVFVQVLLVTLIIQRMLSEKDKRARLEKLNMVIGAFFSEVGVRLLRSFMEYDARADTIRSDLLVKGSWSAREFATLSQRFRAYECQVDSRASDLDGLKCLLVGKRGFLLRLLENPNLLEHETFTDLLWAVFHLTEELDYRADLHQLPTSDYAHLSTDMKRAYVLLISEWLTYMGYLREAYPYLFSLAMRMNPFDPNASPVVAG